MNLLNTTVLQAIAFVLFLLALPLLSFGTMDDQQVLWWAGLVMIVVAGLLPPAARFLVPEEDDEEDEADEGPDEGAEKTDDDSDEADDSERRPPAEGPIGDADGGPGREPQRARVEEQKELASDEGEKEDKS